jgi:hypothetical protein
LEGTLTTTQRKNTACEFLTGCDFFVTIMASVPQFSEKMQEKYCLDDFRDCARYAYAKRYGHGSIPEDLFPSAPSL